MHEQDRLKWAMFCGYKPDYKPFIGDCCGFRIHFVNMRR